MTQVVLQEDRRQISLGGGVNYAYAFPATCRPSQTDASSITDLVSPFANVPSEKHRIAGRSIHPPTGKRAQQATIMGKSLQIAGIATRRQERGSSSGRAAASSADSLTAHVGDVQYVRISPPSASASAGTSPGHPSGTRQGAPTRRQRVVDVARWCAPMDELLSEFAPREGGEDAVVTGPRCRLGVSGSVLRSRIMVRGGIAMMLQSEERRVGKGVDAGGRGYSIKKYLFVSLLYLTQYSLEYGM